MDGLPGEQVNITLAIRLSSEPRSRNGRERKSPSCTSTEIGKKAWLFAKLEPGRARKRINAT